MPAFENVRSGFQALLRRTVIRNEFQNNVSCTCTCPPHASCRMSQSLSVSIQNAGQQDVEGRNACRTRCDGVPLSTRCTVFFCWCFIPIYRAKSWFALLCFASLSWARMRPGQVHIITIHMGCAYKSHWKRRPNHTSIHTHEHARSCVRTLAIETRVVSKLPAQEDDDGRKINVFQT